MRGCFPVTERWPALSSWARSRRRHDVPPTPSWAVPPARTPALPIRAAVVASDRLTVGLAAEWTQVGVPGWQEPDSAARLDADLVLVEVGPDTPRVGSDLLDRIPEDAPLVVWVSSGSPDEHSRPLLARADVVFVALASQLPAWQRVAPEARLLPPAASSRVRPVAGALDRASDPRSGVVVVSRGPVAPAVAGPVATVLARALRPLAADLTVHRAGEGGYLPRSLALRAYGGPAEEGIGSASVVVDGPRTAVDDTWTVVEAAARRTPVVSLAGLPQPEGLEVLAASDAVELRSETIALLHQPELRDREGHVLHRAVRRQHTLAHRVAAILDATGLDAIGLERPVVGRSVLGRSVSAIVPTNRRHELDNVLRNIGRQDHENLELVLVLHGLTLDHGELKERATAAGVRHLTIVEAEDTESLGACMNLGLAASGGDYVAKMDDDNHYGAHYLGDLLDAFDSSGAGIVGKWAHYVWLRSTGAVVLRYPDAEHTYQQRIQGGSMLFRRDVLDDLRFSDLPRGVDTDILDRAVAAGVKIWSGDRFNYVSIRGADRSAHTWTVADTAFLTATGRLEFFGDPRTHVEV